MAAGKPNNRELCDDIKLIKSQFKFHKTRQKWAMREKVFFSNEELGGLLKCSFCAEIKWRWQSLKLSRRHLSVEEKNPLEEEGPTTTTRRDYERFGWFNLLWQLILARRWRWRKAALILAKCNKLPVNRKDASSMALVEWERLMECS